MAREYTREIYLYINGQQINNDIKSIRGEMLKLTNQQAKMTIGSKEYVEAGKKITIMRGILADHQASLKQTEGAWGKLKGVAEGFNKYIGVVASFAAGLAGVGLGLKSAIDSANNFEERLGNLSALTGLTGKELEWLGKSAKDSSIKVTEGGVRIQQSASDIVDAYTKMGSQRPELLKNKEALAAVTEDAIILSEASKSELEPAVAALATTMNQFNTQASDSRRIINILAAGSKEGAAEIPYLTEALEKTGTTANMMGMSIEQTVGMIEAVAPKFAEARVAGTGFDRVLMIMSKNNIGFKDGVFDMNQALDELRVRYANGQSAVDLFGMEHAKMANVMLQAQGDFNKYTKAVTDSQVALEQAKKNTANNNAILQTEKNNLALVALELGQKLAPAQIFATQTFTGFVKALMQAPQWISKNSTLLIALAGAILAYNSALIKSIALSVFQTGVRIKDAVVLKALIVQEAIQIALTAAQAAQTTALTFAQKVAVVSQLALNTAMKANPIGLVIAGITGLVAAINYYSIHNKRAAAIEKEKNAVIQEATDKNNALSETYKTVSGQIDTLSTLSIQEKRDLQDKIDKTIELAESEYILLKNRREATFENSKKLNPGQWLVTGGASGDDQKQAEMRLNNAKKAVLGIDESLQKMRETIDSMNRSKIDLSQILNAEELGDAINEETDTKLDLKLQRYQTALKNVARGSEDYLRILGKIKQVQDLMNESTGGSYGDDKTGKEKKKLEDEITKTIEDAYQKRLLLLKQNYINEKLTQSLYEGTMFAEEIRYLEELIAARRKHGLSTVTEEQKLQDKLIEVKNSGSDRYKNIEEDFYTWSDKLLADQFADMDAKDDEEIAAQKRVSDALLGIKTEQINKEAALTEKARQDRLDKIDKIEKIATSSIDTVLKFQEAAMNRELAAAGTNTKKREEIEKKYNEKKRKWAVAQAIVDGALEVAKIWLTTGSSVAGIPLAIIMTALAVARTAGTIAVIKSQQFAEGKYPDVSTDTGVSQSIQSPLLPGIPLVKTPQFADGKYPDVSTDTGVSPSIQSPLLPGIPVIQTPQFADGKYPDDSTDPAISPSIPVPSIPVMPVIQTPQFTEGKYPNDSLDTAVLPDSVITPLSQVPPLPGMPVIQSPQFAEGKYPDVSTDPVGSTLIPAPSLPGISEIQSPQFAEGKYPKIPSPVIAPDSDPVPVTSGTSVPQSPEIIHDKLPELLGYDPITPFSAPIKEPEQAPPIHRQFTKGKYPVMGADDKRIYQANFLGKVRTGLYKTPTLGLFSEKEPEIVIDGPTTRRIRANFPQILNAIQSVRVNQYAKGMYPDPVDNVTSATAGLPSILNKKDPRDKEQPTSDISIQITDLLQANMQMMRQVILSHEKPGTVSFKSIRDTQAEYDLLKSKSTIL